MTIIGACSLPLLPVGLELAVEVTRNADASSALLFFFANGLGVIFLAVEDALRAGLNATPPLNMKKALIFQGAVILGVCLTVFGIRGEQTRRKRDAAAARNEGEMQLGEANNNARPSV
jgi:FLVCR family MFS transporter 7